MVTLARHLIAIAVLPFTVTVVIPFWIARINHVGVDLGANELRVAAQLTGLALVTFGVVLFGASLRHFVMEGRGTLAPWDPPQQLVVQGPYRYVRNPMISGVLFILFGEAFVLLSWPHLQWAILFAFINAVYIPALEEPLLRQRFGDSYREYCRRVPRFIPRLLDNRFSV